MIRAWCLTLLCVRLAGLASAQEFPTDKGCWALDGSVSFTSQSGDLFDPYSVGSDKIFTFSPEALYFVSPGLAIGGAVNYIHESYGGSSARATGIGPALKYYFSQPDPANIKGSFLPYIGVAFLYTSLEGGNLTSFGGSLGGSYMLSGAMALDLSLSVASHSANPDGPGDSISGTQVVVGVGVGGFIY